MKGHRTIDRANQIGQSSRHCNNYMLSIDTNILYYAKDYTQKKIGTIK